MRIGRLRRIFDVPTDFSLTATLACCCAVLFSAMPCGAANDSSARLTIQIVVVPVVQTTIPVLLNSGTSQAVGNVTFDLTSAPQQTLQRTDVRVIQTESLETNQELMSPDRSNESILQTLTVVQN